MPATERPELIRYLQQLVIQAVVYNLADAQWCLYDWLVYGKH
jgi:hypothetical protein